MTVVKEFANRQRNYQSSKSFDDWQFSIGKKGLVGSLFLFASSFESQMKKRHLAQNRTFFNSFKNIVIRQKTFSKNNLACHASGKTAYKRAYMIYFDGNFLLCTLVNTSRIYNSSLPTYIYRHPFSHGVHCTITSNGNSLAVCCVPTAGKKF